MLDPLPAEGGVDGAEELLVQPMLLKHLPHTVGAVDGEGAVVGCRGAGLVPYLLDHGPEEVGEAAGMGYWGDVG